MDPLHLAEVIQAAVSKRLHKGHDHIDRELLVILAQAKTPIHASDLQRRIRCSTATLNRRLGDWIGRGWVERMVAPEDRRCTQYRPSAALLARGAEVAEEIRRELENA
jgi:DNA-binding MarR family transcriptional regulator